jgi:Tat protein secretion system quality control protein TatD with DNase activity
MGMRYGWYLSCAEISVDWNQNLQAAVVQVGIDLELFRYLVESDAPLSVQQLSEKTGSEPELLSK